MINRSLIGSVKHVYSEDEAFDRSDAAAFDAAMKAFLKDGDLSILPLREGRTPAVFVLRPLKRLVNQHVNDLLLNNQASQAFTEAVAFGLAKAEGYSVDDIPVQLAYEKQEVKRRGFRLTEDCLDQIFDTKLFTELGLRIIEISQLDFRRGQG